MKIFNIYFRKDVPPKGYTRICKLILNDHKGTLNIREASRLTINRNNGGGDGKKGTVCIFSWIYKEFK